MKAKTLIVCLLFLGSTAFAGPYILSHNIIDVERPVRQTIKIHEVYKNFILPQPHYGLKPTIASGNTINLVIQSFYTSKYGDKVPSDGSTVIKVMAARGNIFPGDSHYRIPTIFNDGIFRYPPVKVAGIV